MTDIEIFAVIVAALIHDYEHTGTTNAFHVNTRSVSTQLLGVTVVVTVWPGGGMVKALDCDSRGREFDSQLFHCQIATLGKLFTHISSSSIIWCQSYAVMFCGWKGNCRSGVALVK